ncbi:MAG: glyoxalase [Candidatus Eisenbacteria bacterium]|uniref:Glyoxalase n=1 Tax=Eiseniibacteriota bacterium TaxID=2212470 RepID=A0A849T2N4_UNCEI|nr:glyoxalase [Candidatus Eisenbacteria bacterium]
MRLLRSTLASALFALLFAFAARAAEVPLVQGVGPIEITVSDLDRSVKFFTEVLTFRKVAETETMGEGYEHLQGVFGAHVRQATLALGDEQIQLTEYLAPRGLGRPETQRSNDRWFQHVAIIVSDMDAAYRRLREFKVEHASTAPQTLPAWNPNAGGISAFYFRDPDGHALEILHFPAGKGAQRWHRKDRMFLGIDHTAIVVHDTDLSLAFYRDLLGMKVAGGAENWGVEQERLNNVYGAHLRITSLTAGAGPSIELLEYLAPGDGRPYPADEHANDLIHWQTTLKTRDLDAAAKALRAARSPMVSGSAVQLPDRSLGFSKALIVRDPDGHAMEVVQE